MVAHGLLSAQAPSQWDGVPTVINPVSSHPDYSNWEVMVHSRDQSTFNTLTQVRADHGGDCGGNPDPRQFPTHPQSAYETAVYPCNNHVMTAIGEGGYGLIAMTPNQLLDFAAGGVIEFEMSTWRNSDRDWVDFWIQPFATAHSLPFNQGAVDLQPGSPRAVQIEMLADNRSHFTVAHWEGFDVVQRSTSNASYDNVLVADKARRDRFRISISQNFVRLSMPNYGDYELVSMAFNPPLQWSAGVLTLAHHSYNPTKGSCVHNCPAAPEATSWHWDEVHLTPSSNFSITHTAPRQLSLFNYGDAGRINFNSAAPAGGLLRFSGQGTISLRFSGQSNFTRVEPQIQYTVHSASYIVPVPAGATFVDVRFEPVPLLGWYGCNFGCRVKDAHIWSLNGGAPSTPTAIPPSPSATVPLPTFTPVLATPTATAINPTSTPPAPSPTAPVVTATSTAVLPTPTPSATLCRVPVQNANGGYGNRTGTLQPWPMGGQICVIP